MPFCLFKPSRRKSPRLTRYHLVTEVPVRSFAPNPLEKGKNGTARLTDQSIPTQMPAKKSSRADRVAGNEQETYECDVLVVGSGCAGMSAAVTAGHHGLNVLIVEKEPRFGGTTARSGGWLWIPGTSLARAWGIEESPEQAKTYLRHEAGNSFDAARVDAFLSAGPEAVDFFTSKTAVRFDMPLTFPDYHAEAPGGAQGGRSMVTRPFDGRELGAHIKDSRRSPARTHRVRHDAGLRQGNHPLHARDQIADLGDSMSRSGCRKHAMDVMRHGRGMTLTNGNALAGRLAKSAFDLKIPLWLSSPVHELVVEDGAVRGADRRTPGQADPRQCQTRRRAGLRRLPA